MIADLIQLSSLLSRSLSHFPCHRLMFSHGLSDRLYHNFVLRFRTAHIVGAYLRPLVARTVGPGSCSSIHVLSMIVFS